MLGVNIREISIAASTCSPALEETLIGETAQIRVEISSEENEIHMFYGADRAHSGYRLEAIYLDPAPDDAKPDMKVLARFRASGHRPDPLGMLTQGHSDALAGLPEATVLGPIHVDKEISLQDYQILRDRLIGIEQFSWEYDDEKTLLNVGRAFAQLFRAAALREDLSEFLATTPLGDFSVVQY